MRRGDRCGGPVSANADDDQGVSKNLTVIAFLRLIWYSDYTEKFALDIPRRRGMGEREAVWN